MLKLFYVILIVLMYLFSGINKARNFSKTVNGFYKKLNNLNLPYICYQFIIAMVILIEIIAPSIIIVASYFDKYKQYAYYSSICLAVFTVLATLIYHSPPSGSHYYFFMKNLTAIGSLMLLSNIFKDVKK